MVALWDLGRASAPEIHRRVGEPTGSVYTTMVKVLDRLFAKGLVTRERMDRSFVYTPIVQRDRVERARMGELPCRVLQPDVKPAVATSSMRSKRATPPC
jgi:predicted transcriptional regulator